MMKYLAVGMVGGVVIGMLVAFLGVYGIPMLRSLASIC